MFCFGNSQKKRPNNLVLGRTYGGRVLDIFEFGVENYVAMEQFKASEIEREMKPVLIFQGESFEFSEAYRRLKNYFIGELLTNPLTILYRLFCLVIAEGSQHCGTQKASGIHSD